MFPYGETVVVLRGTAVDDPYSNEPGSSLDWTNPTRITVEGCGVDTRYSDDRSSTFSDPVITGLRVFMPPGTDVTHQDRLEIRGEVYEVEGQPFDWHNPYSGWRPGLEVTVTRIEG